MSERPAPPPGARNLVMVILDSLRYDSWVEAQPVVLGSLGRVERRFSYASWTAPSHYNLLMGLLPHTQPAEVYASEYYKEDFLRYSERLGVGEMGFRRLLPSICPAELPAQRRWATARTRWCRCRCSTRTTVLNRDFDSFELMPKHNDMARDAREAAVQRRAAVVLPAERRARPTTRTRCPTRTRARWPRISGVHGVFKHLDEHVDDERAPRVLRQPVAARAARPPGRGGHLHRHGDQAPVRPAAVEHVGDRDVRPRRAVRRGQVTSATGR